MRLYSMWTLFASLGALPPDPLGSCAPNIRVWGGFAPFIVNRDSLADSMVQKYHPPGLRTHMDFFTIFVT